MHDITRESYQIVQAWGGKYTGWVESDQVWAVTNDGPSSTTEGKTSPWLGLGIYNPPDSGVEVIILHICSALASPGPVPLAHHGAFGVQCVHELTPTSLLEPANQHFGHGGGNAVVAFDAATFTACTLQRILGEVGSVHEDVNGGMVLYPGYSLLTHFTKALTDAVISTFLWAEEPIE